MWRGQGARESRPTRGCGRLAEGGVLEFHCLRHACGAWLALAGAHPKAVQSIMRHSTITLTMDTYGHLFPGQDAETVLLFPAMKVSLRQDRTDPCLRVVEETLIFANGWRRRVDRRNVQVYCGFLTWIFFKELAMTYASMSLSERISE